ncbi:MAG: response regulator [Oculatellaceae cyanobacterium bins.114]|nr:response regulator [Oculatellaceae cyanobacterium bins.114]
MCLENDTSLADILIVDDKLENIRFLSDFLSKQNYQVRKAVNGQAALMAAQVLPPDLILLDVNMPGMGGYEVCEYLKSDPKTCSIPVIFLSAGNDIADKMRAFQVGGIDYITKPFQLEEVLARVQTQLMVQNLQKELKTRNEQLQEMLLTLQNTQAELVQKEKLVNANRIAAGIFHEINNPLSFIVCNLVPAADYNQKLVTLIRLYQKHFPDASPEIKDFIEDIDLDFLVPDFIKLLQSIQTGADRIRSVVDALRIFSRLDESGIKPINVCESVDSVLTLLQYQLQLEDGLVEIRVFKNYKEIPLFLGHASLFNQALLNLLQNAIDALALKTNQRVQKSFQPMIWIDTLLTDKNEIQLCIKDNGVGISQADESHLFEPFFTTKPIGQGVGLGLFTSYQIITKLHKGHLSYQPRSSGGSEFMIHVPISRE